MKQKMMLEIEFSRHEFQAAKECAARHGEKSVKAMLKSFVETELRNFAFDRQTCRTARRFD